MQSDGNIATCNTGKENSDFFFLCVTFAVLASWNEANFISVKLKNKT